MSARRDRRFSSNYDDAPHCRLFIIGPKCLSEDDFRKAFHEFGRIEEVWSVKDRATGEKKGVTYIKFSKTSEAAKALEAMNGKSIGGGRSLKVMIASSREQGSKKDSNEEDYLRLFVIVPKSMTDSELFDYFKKFGEINYASVIRDKNTGDSKGFAYVKYTTFVASSTAYEQCDRKYKAVFAEPKKPKEEREMPIMHSNKNGGGGRSSLLAPPDNYRDEGFNKLIVIASPTVNQDQMWKLFDIVPTMDYCDVQFEGDRMRPSKAIAEVIYSNSQWAAYAKDKFHGFEYPPGYRLIVKPEINNKRSSSSMDKPDILKIAETIAQATSLIQAAGLSPEILQSKLGLTNKMNQDFCSVRLPEPQPLVSIDAEMKARCFIVCSPSALPSSVLKDVFSRFGSLIEVYMLNNRNCGYARYASEFSAKEAIETLHGAEVLGIRLKVIEAEERSDRKRQRLDDTDSKYGIK